MSIYKETRPEIWTVMGWDNYDLNKISKIVHFENMDHSHVSTKCGVSRLKIPTPYFNVTRNIKLVTCKKCLKTV